MNMRVVLKLYPKFLAAWAIAAATLLGVASAIAQLFPSIAAPRVSAIAITVGSLLVAGAYASRSVSPEQLPVSELIPEGFDATSTLRLECTTDRAAILQVHRLAEEVYPGVAPMPSARYAQWLAVNPSMFVCLFDASRTVVGYFDIFPLRGDFLQLMVDGLAGEQDIRREHILPPNEASRTGGLYLGGVAVRDWHRHESKRNAAVLVWGILDYLDHHYRAEHSQTLYAHAVSREGTKLLQRCGFRLAALAKGRREPFDLYEIVLSKEFRERARASIPDYSKLVHVGWRPSAPRLRLVRGRVA